MLGQGKTNFFFNQKGQGKFFFSEEPVARVCRVYINKEEVLQKLIKKTKQNLTKEATAKTTAAVDTKPTILSSSRQTSLCTPRGRASF
jgi:hypothetical protein